MAVVAIFIYKCRGHGRRRGAVLLREAFRAPTNVTSPVSLVMRETGEVAEDKSLILRQRARDLGLTLAEKSRPGEAQEQALVALRGFSLREGKLCAAVCVTKEYPQDEALAVAAEALELYKDLKSDPPVIKPHALEDLIRAAQDPKLRRLQIKLDETRKAAEKIVKAFGMRKEVIERLEKQTEELVQVAAEFKRRAQEKNSKWSITEEDRIRICARLTTVLQNIRATGDATLRDCGAWGAGLKRAMEASEPDVEALTFLRRDGYRHLKNVRILVASFTEFEALRKEIWGVLRNVMMKSRARTAVIAGGWVGGLGLPGLLATAVCVDLATTGGLFPISTVSAAAFGVAGGGLVLTGSGVAIAVGVEGSKKRTQVRRALCPLLNPRTFRKSKMVALQQCLEKIVGYFPQAEPSIPPNQDLFTAAEKRKKQKEDEKLLKLLGSLNVLASGARDEMFEALKIGEQLTHNRLSLLGQGDEIFKASYTDLCRMVAQLRTI